VFQFDLLDSPGVEQLAGDPQHAPTHRLLSLLLAGDVKVGSTASQILLCRWRSALPF